MATFDPDEMVQRFKERAMLGDAEVSLDGGVLTLRIDLRPPDQR